MSDPRPTVVLGRRGVLRLRSGHPWIYEDQLARRPERDEPGLVVVEGPAGRPRGHGVFNPRSRIPLRLVETDPDVAVDDDFWVGRLDRAVARRADGWSLGEEAYRWVHAEADGLPGLVVDRYADVAVVQAGCAWADAIAPALARHLVERHGMRGVLARHDGAFRDPERLARETKVLAGEVPELVETSCGSLSFVVDPWRGPKTGAFLDQRVNRRRATALLPEGTALDVFCADGGFATYLAARGRRVEAIDSSARLLAHARRHAERNGVAERIAARAGNAFELLREDARAGRRVDAIVLDPPALAKGRRDLPAATRGYKELNLRAMELLRPGGRLLTCSCSQALGPEAFEAVLAAAAADARRRVRVVAALDPAPCHPHLLTFPESRYLKALVLEAE